MSERAGSGQILLRGDAGGVATLTLNRPRSFNALSQALVAQLQAALDSIAADGSVRVVVIAGAGNAFCAGHDLKEMRARPDPEFQQALFRQCSHMMLSIARMPQPVIARVQGVAAAAGCQLVAACDLAVAAGRAQFAVSGIKLGLFCATPSVALTRNVSRKQAFEMLFTGDMIDAAQALHRGLVNRVVPFESLDAEVARLAGSIAAKSPLAVATGKRLFYRQLEMGTGAAYQLAAQAMACNMLEADACEGIDAFLERGSR